MSSGIIRLPLDLAIEHAPQKLKELFCTNALLQSNFLEQCANNGVHFQTQRSIRYIAWQLSHGPGKKPESFQTTVPFDYFFPSYILTHTVGCALRTNGLELSLHDTKEPAKTGMQATISYRPHFPQAKVTLLQEGLIAYRDACVKQAVVRNSYAPAAK